LQKTSGPTELGSVYGFLCAVVAAAVLFMINSAAVSLAAGLQTHNNPFVLWFKGTRQSAVQEMALFALGLAAAMIVKQAPWAIVLMLAPVIAIYYSFNRMTALNLKVENQLKELKTTQAHLVESARMASIGTMVAGIAHQINNPIFVIRGRAETLVEDSEEHLKTPSAKKAVQVIFEMADRVSRIVNSLMPTSQVSEDGMGCCDVNDVVRNTLLLLEPKFLKSSIDINTILAKSLPLCLGDPCQIQEMFINLVDNACNAMPDGGKLVVRTRETKAGLSICVSDTGIGISPENLSSIFSPFFTTRKGSGGVGLGLYVSNHIAEKYGGNISVESHLGRGTVFTVTLPNGSKKLAGTGRHKSEDLATATAAASARRQKL
jgi:signal transduction histidine kinase